MTREFVVRAPGRVNLVGEHIDYAGLPVLPMAIDRGLTLRVRARDDGRVRVASEASPGEPRAFDVSVSIPSGPSGDWGNYAKAAIQGLMAAGHVPAGFDARISSDLPLAAGLSSSSALVVGTALAGLAAAGRPVSADPGAAERLSLATLLARAEGYVGVRGGGMDQAAILAGRRGHALRVAFDPLRVRPVALPDGWAFVVAHSLLEAEKSGGARTVYNRRRGEVERALEVVTARLGAPAAGYAELLAAHSAAHLLDTGDRLPPPLAARFRHVVTEAFRVEQAIERLDSADAFGFGAVLLASHASLREAFEVSTPELDALVEAAVTAGAHGARLTGAGLGGCIVALVDEDSVDGFVSELGRAFYGPRGVDEAGDRVFRVRPADGAATLPAA